MALSLKDQFQIRTATAYTAADGKRFLDLADAQQHTRDKMLDSLIATAIKNNPEYARLDKPLLKDFLLFTGAMAGAIMAEKLEPADPVAVTNTPRAGETAEQSAARLRESSGDSVVDRMRAAAGINARPVTNTEPPMPRAVNPDIFQNRNPVLRAADAVDADDQLSRELDEQVTAAMKLAGHG